MKILKKQNNHLIHILFIVVCITYILPFWLIAAVSLSSESDIYNFGYRLIPKKIDLTAYKFILTNSTQILNGYKVTVFNSVVGTAISIVIMGLCAYSLSRSNFKYKNALSFFFFFTMVFSAGLVPKYILITKYLHLKNTIWVYIVPDLVNAFHLIIFRTFFKALPTSLFDAAKMDGASELQIFFKIVFPMSTPVFATIALLGVLGRWNEWQAALLYIEKQELYSLQYILQRMLTKLEFVKNNYGKLPRSAARASMKTIPTESVRMAIALVVAGPALLIFPFFQKYFTKGLTVGAIKG